MKHLLSLFILITISLFAGIFSLPDNRLHLVTCDVGQGDANLIFYKNTQVLIDGGRGTKVMDCLQKHLPFWDKTLEMDHRCERPLGHDGGETGCECRCQPRWWLNVEEEDA